MKRQLTEQAYKEAIKILEACKSDIGFKASALDDGYHQVWARDAMITLLGILLSDNRKLIDVAKKSLTTLREFQTTLGLIPNSVDVRTNEADYRAAIDGMLWYILGIYSIFKKTGKKEIVEDYYPSIQKALNWLAYQDVDNSGLISIQEAADWQDFFSVRGKVLYDNALYCRALVRARDLAQMIGKKEEASEYGRRAARTKIMIQELFWVRDAHEHMATDLQRLEKTVRNSVELEEEKLIIAENVLYNTRRPYFLAFRSFRQTGEWFDTFGNMLAVLFDIAEKEQPQLILDYMHSSGATSPFPAKSITPPVFPGDTQWRTYFKKANLNLPYQYHNGGIWPFLGGFYVAALVKNGRHTEAAQQLEALARLNALGKHGQWEFNEWFHGITGTPMGREKQAWSAAMYIFAYHCAKTKQVPLL